MYCMYSRKLRAAFPILAILLLAFIFRFAYLDRIPTAISGDELVYAITAKSIALTGHDISGTWNPLSVFLFRYPPDEQQAELPYFLHLAAGAHFPFSLLFAKLPFAVLSVGVVALLLLIATELFGPVTGIAAGFVAAINPWLVVMGRTGYESTPATFFYLAGLYAVLKLRSWKILWSLVPFVLAFYSYIATKVIFVPFILLAAFLSYGRQKTKKKAPYLLLCLISVLLVVVYVILLRTNPTGSRFSDLLLPSSAVIASQVDALRKDSLASVLVPFTVNKYTVYVQVLASKLFRIFSPEYLFTQGDQFFLPISQSFFYYIDSIFIVLGAFLLFSKKRAAAFMMFLFILIGTIPHVLHKNISDFSDHLALMFPFLVILIGIGMGEGVTTVSKQFRVVAVSVIGIVYTFSVIAFVNAYFFRYPITGSGDFPMRILASYIRLAKTGGHPITVYSTRNGDFLKKYLFYTDGMNSRTVSSLSRINTKLPFEFDGVHFTDCDAKAVSPAAGSVAVYDASCDVKLPGTNTHIARLSDGGILYTIAHDPLCDHASLNAYPTGITVADLAVEKLSPSAFCKTYISQ